MSSRALILRIVLGMLSALLVGATHAVAQEPPQGTTPDDSFYRVPVSELTLTEGTLPEQARPELVWFDEVPDAAHAVLDGEGEAVVVTDSPVSDGSSWRLRKGPRTLSVRAPAGTPVTGRLFVPRDQPDGMVVVRFTIAPQAARPDGAQAFWRDRKAHFDELRQSGSPGTAWFRHEAERSARLAGDAGPAEEASRFGVAIQAPTRNEAQETYDLFSGQRAMAENLALDKSLRPDPAPGAASVDIDTLEGITVAPIDWAPLLDATPPALDPLASHMPADQHALFFPSFNALTAVLDEAQVNGTPLVDLFEAHSVDRRSQSRTEHQLALDLSPLARQFGPHLVQSVAVTGSGLDLRLGSDVAVLLQSAEAPALAALLHTRQLAALAATPGAEASEGRTGDLAWSAVRSPDRALCSYLASFDDVVFVTNSPVQLARLDAVRAGRVPALATQPEYLFFRQRYVRGDPGESALLVLTDAAIRRLCGPHWRIGESRRTRALALLAERTAAAIDTRGVPADGDEALAPYGNLSFLTPIAELALDRVTDTEAAAYARFRDTYQDGWRRSFDPIAVRLSVGPTTLEADLTVRPLLLRSDYRDYVEIAGGADIAAGDGDPHADTLVHLLAAVNPLAPAMDEFKGYMRGGSPDASIDPLAWMGSSFGFWVDDDPLWKELDSFHDADEFFTERGQELPVVVFVAVKDAAAARAFVERMLTEWSGMSGEPPTHETRTHAGLDYVRLALTDDVDEEADLTALYYAITPDLFVMSPDEHTLQRALERATQRRQGTVDAPPSAWSGHSANVHVTRGLLDAPLRKSIDDALRARCFDNLPILNAWHSRFTDEDPVAAHDRLWQERLVCPGGGHYAWNDAWQTMACSTCGHPGEPVRHPARPPALTSFQSLDLGLTFEDDGLRAHVTLRRSKP